MPNHKIQDVAVRNEEEANRQRVLHMLISQLYRDTCGEPSCQSATDNNSRCNDTSTYEVQTKSGTLKLCYYHRKYISRARHCLTKQPLVLV